MRQSLDKKDVIQQEEFNSLKGTLFSTIVFVGGGILAFMIVLFFFYMIRL